MTRLTSAALGTSLGPLYLGAVLGGMGLGGVWVARSGTLMVARDASLRRILPLGAAGVIALLGAVMAWVPLRAVGAAGAIVVGVLAYTLALGASALVGAAVALSLRWTAEQRAAPRASYGAVSAGGAAGVAGSLATLNALGPPWTLSLGAIAALLASVRFGVPRRATWVMVPILGVALLSPIVRPNEPNVATTKPLASFLDQVLYPDSELLETRWDATSRVDVFGAPGAQLLWHTPSRAREPLPDLRGIAIDADAVTTAVGSIELGRAASLARRMPASLPFAIGTRDRVLVLGAGGGMDVEAALGYGARQVDAVEENRGVAQMVLGPLATFTDDILRRRGVQLAVEDGRAFARRALRRGDRYDAIVLSTTESWGALTAGAHALAPTPLYTREAFDTYYTLLADGGVLSVGEWYAQPPREVQRLAGLARQAVLRAGGDPVRQVMLLRSGQFGTLGTLLVRRGAFTPTEVGQAQTFARDNGYGVVYTPGDPSGDMAAVLAGLDDGATDGRLPTDDRPFLFAHGTARALSLGRAPWPPAQAHVSLVIALLAAGAFLAVSLRSSGGAPDRRGTASHALAGFGAGLGAVALTQRGALLAGSPALGSLLTVCGLLLGATGAALALGRRQGRRRVELALGAVAVWIVAPLSGLAPEALAPWPVEARALATLAGGAVAGVALGAGLPSGGALLPGAAPWAWGVSWSAAAVGAALAVGLAPELGLGGALAVAGVCLAAASVAVSAPAGTEVPGGKSLPRGANQRKMRYS
ncbi:MAG TPA: hypothetical protein VFX49_00740 [Chloroflexota bacterium]|nr:hypothetical protein [Chloroflexota bacterium]